MDISHYWTTCLKDHYKFSEIKMWPQLFLIGTLVLTAYASPLPQQERRSALIRCDSFLRIIFPDRYPDCSCTYSEWSEWTPIPDSTVRVSSSQCPSGEAYQDIRQRTATIEGCPTPVEKETRWMCKLIMSFPTSFNASWMVLR